MATTLIRAPARPCGRWRIIAVSMTSPLNVAILAAGQGKRMHSALPKVLHLLAGRPLITHVLTSARALSL